MKNSMAIAASISVDYRDFTDFKNKVYRFKHVRDKQAEKEAQLIRHEATLNAPHDTGRLRRSGTIQKLDAGKYSISFSRYRNRRSSERFDVAKWLHDPEKFLRSSYTPSDPNPRVGPKYLQRAWEDNLSEIEGRFAMLFKNSTR